MDKVLISFVGDQDPYSEKTNTEGAIVTLANFYRPEMIFMLPTKRMPPKSETETNAEETKEWLCSESFDKNKIFIHPLSLSDPRNIPQILELGSNEIKVIINNMLNPKEMELIINTSSGTPQMQSCWHIWANSGLFAPFNVTLYQVSNPDYVDSEDPEDRIEEINVEFMEETNTVRRIEDYLESAMFQVASEEAKNLSRISSYSHRRMKADIIRELCIAYHHWDQLNYGEAQNKLGKIYSTYDKALDMQSLISLLKKQLDFLNKLNRVTEEDIYNLTDICYNAHRRYKQHGYADALARVWRVIEGCLYYRLRNNYGIEPRDIENSNNAENKNKIINYINVNAELSFFKSVQALENALNDTSFIAFKRKEQKLPWSDSFRNMSVAEAMEEIRNIRNMSVIAHGTKPVSRDIARLALEMSKLFLVFSFKDESFLNSYPFKGDESRAELAKILL